MSKRVSTNILSTLRSQPENYSWGEIVKIHDVGKHYSIVEYVDADHSTCFHAYVDDKPVSSHTSTFDDALIEAIAHRNLDKDSSNEAWYMARACKRILNILP